MAGRGAGVHLGRWLLVFATALFLGGCAPKGDPLSASKEFFEQLASGDTSGAYSSAAFGFQAEQSEKAFEQRVREMGLNSIASTSWGAPELKGREARVPVTITTRAQATLPFVVTLVRESDVWRVHALKAAGGDVRQANQFSLVGKGLAFTDALNKPMPQGREVNALVRATLVEFNEALQQKSFAGFYQWVSTAWQNQLTESQLQRAFQPFMDRQIDFAGIAELEPVIDVEPTINSEGLLLITGHYDAAPPRMPYKLHFALKHVYELPNWKLFGLDLSLTK